MKYNLSQGYRFYMGEVVLMYFIETVVYTFDTLPSIIQEHPEIQLEAMSHRDYDDDDMWNYSNYLMWEQMHPLVFNIQIENPELMPQDD